MATPRVQRTPEEYNALRIARAATGQLITITDFNLVRKPREVFMDERIECATPFIDKTTTEDWRFFAVRDPNKFGDATFTYAVCVSQGMFVIFEAFLTGASGRYTEMRLWELVLDSWVDAVAAAAAAAATAVTPGPPPVLRYLAVHDILHAATRRAIEREIRTQQGAGAARAHPAPRVTARPGAVDWRANVFVGCAGRVAAALRGGARRGVVVVRAAVRSVYSAALAAQLGVGGPPAHVMDMVIELGVDDAPPARGASPVPAAGAAGGAGGAGGAAAAEYR